MHSDMHLSGSQQAHEASSRWPAGHPGFPLGESSSSGAVRRALALLLAAGALLLAGCATEPMPDWVATTESRPYLLEVGDVVDVHLFDHPRLTIGDVPIQPDGRMVLHLLGGVEARGRTTEGLAELLEREYREAGVMDPDVVIRLRRAAGLRVFVGGEVNSPGMIAHNGNLTLLAALLSAGGITNEGSRGSVVLLRDPGDGSPPLQTEVDVGALIDGEMPAPPLQPYDVVLVPKKTISKMNLFVEQYIVRMIPGNMNYNVGFSYLRGRVKGDGLPGIPNF